MTTAVSNSGSLISKIHNYAWRGFKRCVHAIVAMYSYFLGPEIGWLHAGVACVIRTDPVH